MHWGSWQCLVEVIRSQVNLSRVTHCLYHWPSVFLLSLHFVTRSVAFSAPKTVSFRGRLGTRYRSDVVHCQLASSVHKSVLQSFCCVQQFKLSLQTVDHMCTRSTLWPSSCFLSIGRQSHWPIYDLVRIIDSVVKRLGKDSATFVFELALFWLVQFSFSIYDALCVTLSQLPLPLSLTVMLISFNICVSYIFKKSIFLCLRLSNISLHFKYLTE